MAQFFYAANGQPVGPLDEAELNSRIASGSLAADTMVWREGMPEWKPFSEVRAGGSSAGAAPPPVSGGAACTVCHQMFPMDQVIRYGTTYVCGNCKPQFLQRLREGAVVGGGLNYATVGARFGAKLIDTFLVYAINLGIGFGAGAAAPNSANDPMFALALFAINLALAFAYPIYFLGKWGQTLGKMAVKVKVVTPEGAPIGYGRATGRVFAEMVTGFTFGIGYLMAIWDAEKRSLHDRIAGTRVINAPGK